MRNFFLMLTDTLRDMSRSSGFRKGFLKAVFLFLAAAPALLFSYRMMRFNRLIRMGGTRFAARRLLPLLYKNAVAVTPLPDFSGGGLLVCNHPGIGDSLALLALLPPGKFRLVAHERDFFRAMPEVWKRLILVPENPAERHRTVGNILDAVAKEELVVLYPAGAIEPDPAFRQWGWLESAEPLLADWSPAAGMAVRLLAKTGKGRVFPVLASGVFSKRALFSWWASLGANRREKEARAVSYQLFRGWGKDTAIRLAFGTPLDPSKLAEDKPGLEILTLRLKEAAGELETFFTEA